MGDLVGYQTIYGSGIYADDVLGSFSGNEYQGYAFQVGVSGTELKDVKFYAKTVGSPTDNLRCAIYTSTLYHPSTVGYNVPDEKLFDVVITGLSGTYSEVTADFSSQNYVLKRGVTYFVVVYRDGAFSGSNYYHLRTCQRMERPTFQTSSGESANYGHWYAEDTDPANLNNDAVDYLDMKITVTHDEKKDLFSYIHTGMNNLDYLFLNGGTAGQERAAYKITMPDDGKYREIENFMIPIHIRSAGDRAYPDLMMICKADGTNVGEMVEDGLFMISRSALAVATSRQIYTPQHFFFPEGRFPVLDPNTTYFFVFSTMGLNSTSYFNTIFTDDTGSDPNGELYYYGIDGSLTQTDDMAFYVIQGRELVSPPADDDEYTYPKVASTGPYPCGVGGASAMQVVGQSTTNQYVAWAFKPVVDCTLDSLRVELGYIGEAPDLKCRVFASSGDDIDNGTILKDLGVIADSTSSSDKYLSPYVQMFEIDFGNTLSLTAGTKYWIEFHCDSFTSSAYKRWFIKGGSYVPASCQLGIPPDGGTRCWAYSTDDWSTYNSGYSNCLHGEIIGRSSDGIETLINEYDTWAQGTFANNDSRFFYDATERHFAQKIKTPARSGSLEIHTISIPFEKLAVHGSDESVWVEIRAVGGGDSIGSVVTNGATDKVHSDFPYDTNKYAGFINFEYTDKPVLEPDTEYWIFMNSDWTDTSDAWMTTHGQGSTLRFKGIDAGAYDVSSALVKTASSGSPAGYRNLSYIYINGNEFVPPIPPPTDFTLSWPLTERKPKDTITRWPLTNYLEDQDTLIWQILQEANKEWGFLWNILVSTDWILDWNLESPADVTWELNWKILQQFEKDWTIPWKILVSTDTGLDWHLLTQADRDLIIRNILFSAHAEKDWTFPWKLILSKDTIIKYGFLTTQERDWILKWPLTTRFDKDWLLRWKLLLSNDWVLRWPLTSPFSEDWLLKWGILVQTDTILPLPIMGYIDSVKTLLWNIESKVWQDYVLRYGMSGVQQEWTIKYGLRDLISQITALINKIDNQVYNDWGIRYKIKLESDHVLIIPIRGPVTQDFILRHGLLTQIEDVTTIKFNLLEYDPVEADTILRNTLLGKPRFYKIIFS